MGDAGQRQIGSVACAVIDAGGIQVDRRHHQIGRVLSGSYGVIEGEGGRARSAGVGGGSAVVKGERRRPAGDRYILAEAERHCHGLAGVEIAGLRQIADCGDGRRGGVDLRAALGQAGQRQAGGVAGAVGDRDAGRQVERGGGEGGRVLAGRHGGIEGQRIGARAAGVGRGSAVVEGQRRRSARDRHRFAEAERQGDGLARIEIAARRQIGDRADDGGCGVDLRPALGQAGERQVGGVAGAVLDGDAGRQVEGGGGEGGHVLAGRHGVIEGQRAGARAAGVGRRSAVVEGQRRRSAGDRHRLAEAERQRDGLACVQIAGGW